jgi:hypothetical protein
MVKASHLVCCLFSISPATYHFSPYNLFLPQTATQMTSLVQKILAIAALFATIDTTAHAHDGFRGSGGGRGRGGHQGGFDSSDDRNATMFQNITCDATTPELAQNYTCDLRKRRSDEDGVYVCRTRINDLGDEYQFARCIPTDRALESDTCGCCGADETACPKTCDCPCAIPNRFNRDGTSKKGVEVMVDGMADPVCIRSHSAMRMVRRSAEDGELDVTCVEECTPP